MTPQCTGSKLYGRQCDRIDVVLIQFSEHHDDFVWACPEHEPMYRAWVTPLVKIRGSSR